MELYLRIILYVSIEANQKTILIQKTFLWKKKRIKHTKNRPMTSSSNAKMDRKLFDTCKKNSSNMKQNWSLENEWE